jgi:hypothetical protein
MDAICSQAQNVVRPPLWGVTGLGGCWRLCSLCRASGLFARKRFAVAPPPSPGPANLSRGIPGCGKHRTSQARGGPNLPRFSRASIRRDLEQARQRVPSAKPCFLLVRCVRSLLAHRVKSLAAQYLGRFCSEADIQRAALTGIYEYAP